jgi:hypothetical protein
MQNVLIPKAYIVRSFYKKDPFYRATLYAFFIAILTAVAIFVSYHYYEEVHTSVMKSAEEIESQSAFIANKNRDLKQTMESYYQIKAWEPLNRLAFSPILDWVEKNTPPESSIVSMDIELNTVSATSPRTAVVHMEIYISPAEKSPIEKATAWLDNGTEKLKSANIVIKSVTRSKPEEDKDEARTVSATLVLELKPNKGLSADVATSKKDNTSPTKP